MIKKLIIHSETWNTALSEAIEDLGIDPDGVEQITIDLQAGRLTVSCSKGIALGDALEIIQACANEVEALASDP